MAATRFLAEDVPRANLLPYGYQLVILSQFFCQCPDPTPEQRAHLWQWFWATSFSGWFAGANSTQLNDAITQAREYAQGRWPSLFEERSLDAARPFPARFDLRSARVRTLVLVLLRCLRPLLPDGTPLVPRRLWADSSRSFPQVYRRVPGELASNPANRLLLPPDVGPLRPLLLQQNGEYGARVLASHGITEEVRQALVADDRQRFVELRAQRLAEVEREFLRKLGLRPSSVEFGAADIDSGNDE